MQNFRKIMKLRCREICEPQNREINVSRKFHVIRFSETFKSHWFPERTFLSYSIDDYP